VRTPSASVIDRMRPTSSTSYVSGEVALSTAMRAPAWLYANPARRPSEETISTTRLRFQRSASDRPLS
jgi:hypothetical protein